MGSITHLRHVALAVPDYDTAVQFYSGVWGLTESGSDGDVTFFSAEGSREQYVLRLRKADEKRPDLIAFGVDRPSDVDELALRLANAGITLDREPSTLSTPGGGYGFRFFDVDGRLVEISSSVETRAYRTLEARESIPEKLSHVVINSGNVVATKNFYEEHLGFKLSDWLEDKMCFLHTSSPHHVLAIAQGPHVSLNHISFEMRGLDEYMRATGRMKRDGREPLWGPGRHGPGDNTFSYFHDTNHNVVEYTTELQQIDDDEAWQPRVFAATPEQADQWGTGAKIEQLIPAAFNDVDRGLWTPAPM